jgi:YD repeat-containing protein
MGRIAGHALSPGRILLLVLPMTLASTWAGEPVADAPEAAQSPPIDETVIAQPQEIAPVNGEAARAHLIEISCYDEAGYPDSWLDRTHTYFNRRLCAPAAWFDGFFSDERASEETPVGTLFRLRQELLWDETEDWRNRLRLSANLELPGVSRRLRLLVTRDEDLRSGTDADSVTDTTEGGTRIGLRYNLQDRRRSRFDVDASVRANLGTINPILRARYRQVHELTASTFARLTYTGFWEREDGFGLTSRADWEWYRTPETQLRVTGQGTWSEGSNGLDWRYGVVGYRQLGPRTAIRTEIGAEGQTQPTLATREYFVNVRLRRAFLRPWLFYELQPERAWPLDPKLDQRRGDWRFKLTLEIQFENEPARKEREYRGRSRL